jgi:5'-3' exoribonuclease 2
LVGNYIDILEFLDLKVFNMGVPAFFRWLCNRNPHFVIDATSFSPDEESENPEIDNLYLDMNGIIHPCCHSDSLGVPLPTTIFEMFNTVFLYMDLLMNIVRPKKVLYLAIDGVAPRAKMNQQRGRRFRSVQEQKESFARKMKLMENWRTQGILTDEIKEYVINKKPFDKNVITPGTEFMQDLADALEYYI